MEELKRALCELRKLEHARRPVQYDLVRPLDETGIALYGLWTYIEDRVGGGKLVAGYVLSIIINVERLVHWGLYLSNMLLHQRLGFQNQFMIVRHLFFQESCVGLSQRFPRCHQYYITHYTRGENAGDYAL